LDEILEFNWKILIEFEIVDVYADVIAVHSLMVPLMTSVGGSVIIIHISTLKLHLPYLIISYDTFNS
jgi:hypothetical protein